MKFFGSRLVSWAVLTLTGTAERMRFFLFEAFWGKSVGCTEADRIGSTLIDFLQSNDR